MPFSRIGHLRCARAENMFWSLLQNLIMSDVYVLNKNCEMIGSGAFGKVYKSGTYAVKLFNDNCGDEEKRAIDIRKLVHLRRCFA